MNNTESASPATTIIKNQFSRPRLVSDVAFAVLPRCAGSWSISNWSHPEADPTAGHLHICGQTGQLGLLASLRGLFSDSDYTLCPHPLIGLLRRGFGARPADRAKRPLSAFSDCRHRRP